MSADALFLEAVKQGRLQVDIANGRVFNTRTKREIGTASCKAEYRTLGLVHESTVITMNVQRLVWQVAHDTLIPPGIIVVFLDGDKHNCAIDNLDICTRVEAGKRGAASQLAFTPEALVKLRKLFVLNKDVNIAQAATFLNLHYDTVRKALLGETHTEVTSEWDEGVRKRFRVTTPVSSKENSNDLAAWVAAHAKERRTVNTKRCERESEHRLGQPASPFCPS